MIEHGFGAAGHGNWDDMGRLFTPFASVLMVYIGYYLLYIRQLMIAESK